MTLSSELLEVDSPSPPALAEDACSSVGVAGLLRVKNFREFVRSGLQTIESIIHCFGIFARESSFRFGNCCFEFGSFAIAEFVFIFAEGFFNAVNQTIKTISRFDNFFAFVSSPACDSASFIILSISSFDKPDETVIVIFCSRPVPTSFAETLTMPFASISKVTSTCGTPRGAGGIPTKMEFSERFVVRSHRAFAL